MKGKALVAYMTQSGNTKKVADAIYETLQCDKTIADINQITSLKDYNIAFLGFPIIQMGPPAKATSFLKEQCSGKRIALFVTHGASMGLPPLQEWLGKFREAAKDTQLLGLYNYQGEVGQKIRKVMAASDDPQLQMFAKMSAMADGQPDRASLERAGLFAQSIMEAL